MICEMLLKVSVEVEGKYIYNEGIENYTFFVDVKEENINKIVKDYLLKKYYIDNDYRITIINIELMK